MRVGTTESGFTVASADIEGSTVEVSALIEARLSESDIRTTTDPLLRGLRGRGECAPYRIPDPGEQYTELGGLAVTQRHTGWWTRRGEPTRVDRLRRAHRKRALGHRCGNSARRRLGDPRRCRCDRSCRSAVDPIGSAGGRRSIKIAIPG